MKTKAIIDHEYTRRDKNGNIYHTSTIINPNTGKSFITNTPGEMNTMNILIIAFGSRGGIYQFNSCTNSTRITSLPKHLHLSSQNYDKEWRKALRAIGYRKLN